MVRASVVIGFAIVGLAAYRLLAVPKGALPDSTVGASIIEEDLKAASEPKAIVDNLLKTNRVVIFSKVIKVIHSNFVYCITLHTTC